jgi:hypothetical protein
MGNLPLPLLGVLSCHCFCVGDGLTRANKAKHLAARANEYYTVLTLLTLAKGQKTPLPSTSTFGRMSLGFTDAAARATLSMHRCLQSMCALLFFFSRLKRFFTFAKKPDWLPATGYL